VNPRFRRKCFEFYARVTRLGEFSHIWRLFILRSRLKITEVAQIFKLLFPQFQLCINCDKNGCATFWLTCS
jgi:hypothetical protein